MIVPNIDPIAISLGSIHIHWYGIAYVLGICCCWYYARNISHHFSITKKDIDDSITYWIMGIIIGGRLGYVLFYDIHMLLESPIDVLKTWQGGMSFHGGFIGSVIACIVYCRHKKINPYVFGDVIAIVSPLGLIFGRIANFINGEHCGRVTESSIGMIFPHVDNFKRHPSQLYEAFGEGLVLTLLFGLIYKLTPPKKQGFFIFLFLTLYGTIRFYLENFRTPDGIFKIMSIDITIGQILSLPMIIIGMIGLYFSPNTKHNEYE